MTEHEALAVIQRVVSWWPHVEMPAPTVALWVSKLLELHRAAAVDAVDALAGNPEIRYLPTWGEFHEAYDVANRPRPPAWDARRALPSGPFTPTPVAKQHIAAMHSALSAASGPLVRGLAQVVPTSGESLRDRLKRREPDSPYVPSYDETYPNRGV